MGGVNLYNSAQLDKVADISREVEEAVEISQAALDFNVENFHTQLEVWEYAYEPNEKRLNAFKSHDATLIELLNQLIEKVEEEEVYRQEHLGEIAGIFEGGEDQIKEIESNLQLVRDDWENSLFPVVKKLQAAKEAGLDENDEEFRRLEKEARVAVIANEDLFDRLQFNKEVDNFVIAQEKLVKEVIGEQESLGALVSKLKRTMLFLTFVLILMGIVIAIYISHKITKPLNKLSETVDKVSQGNFKVEIEKEGKIDEINKLTDSLDRVMTTMKLAVEEKGPIKIVKKEQQQAEPVKEKKVVDKEVKEQSSKPKVFPEVKK